MPNHIIVKLVKAKNKKKRKKALYINKGEIDRR